MPPEPLRDKTIVVTGVTGQVAEPVAVALAQENQVVGAARFKDEAARGRLEEAGVRCVPIDLLVRRRRRPPRRRRLRDQLRRLQDQRLGPRPAGQQRRPGLADGAPPGAPAAFVHCSTTGVYKPLGHHVFAEEDELGRQPRGLALPAHLQHLQDRRRGHGPVGGGPLRPPHHGGPAVGALRGPGRLAGHPPRDDAQRRSTSPSTSMPPASTTRSTRTTSSPWSRACWRPPPRRRPPSTGAATRPSASRSGAATCPS